MMKFKSTLFVVASFAPLAAIASQVSESITIPANQISIAPERKTKPLSAEAQATLNLVNQLRDKLEARAKDGGLVLLMQAKVLGKALSARAEYWFDGKLRLRATNEGTLLSATQSKCLIESVRARKCFESLDAPHIVLPIDPNLVLKAKTSARKCGGLKCARLIVRTRLRENYSVNPEQPLWFEFDPRDGWIEVEILASSELDLLSMKVTRRHERIELVKSYVPDYSAKVDAH
jgi:hypothetical protein